MKRLLTILLLSLYGLSASGMCIQLHYCCGKVAGISVGYGQQEATECQHGMKRTMPGCCLDDQISIETDDDQGTAHALEIPAAAEMLLASPEAVWPMSAFYEPVSAGEQSTRGSPLPSAVPLYVAHCVFRN